MSEAVPAGGVPAQLTPSELVTLFGDRFAGEGGMLAAKEEVLTSGAKVNAEELARAALAAALLACEEAGTARLETRASRALFGLVKSQKLHLVPGAAPPSWPAGSLEAAFSAAAAAEPTVQDAVTRVLATETFNASQHLLSLVKAGLAKRGLLEVEEKKTLMVFTTAAFHLPEATRAAAGREPLEPVRALLHGAEQRRPELWKALVKDIRAAIVWMTKSND